MHKTVFTWFGNFPMSTELQGFHYYQGKIQSAVVQFFSLSKTTSRNPNHQNNGFYILRIGFTMGYKMGQKKFLKPPLHGLSLRKSSIKNHATSFQVGSSFGSNTTRLHKSQHKWPHSTNPVHQAEPTTLFLQPWFLSRSQHGHLGQTLKHPKPPIPSPQCLILRLNMKALAKEHLRNNFVGFYNAKSANNVPTFLGIYLFN